MISIAAIVSFFGILRIEANPGTQLKRFQTPTHSPTHLYLLANGTLVGSSNAANQNTETKLWEKRSPLGLVYGPGDGGHESSADNGLAYIEVSNEADLLTNIQIRGDGSQVLEFKSGLEKLTLEDTNGCSHKMCYQVSTRDPRTQTARSWTKLCRANMAMNLETLY